MELHENNTEPERVLALSVDTGEFDSEASMAELRELIKTAGGDVAAAIIQHREKPDNTTFLGGGKLLEAQALCETMEIDLIVCDDRLSPNQQTVMEKICGVRVIDRTMLILDIFAASARTDEGKLQVELAQLKYSLPRLSGRGVSMSRLGGGIGTRGPGETKLESDKRHIRRRIHALEEDLEALSKRRQLRRERRKKDMVTTCAIVGYTNAGKSTLLNALTDAGVLTENKLFATLDPTSRAIRLPDGRNVMLIDTVGFISKLPHELIEAFKSTLEEATSADLLLLLCDASDPGCDEQLDVTKEIIKELGSGDTPSITVYNKCDIAGSFLQPANKNSVRISALNGIGLERLLECMTDNLPQTRRRVLLLLPFSEGSLAARVRKEGAVNSEEYRENGLFMDAVIDVAMMKAVIDYILPAEGKNTTDEGE